MQRGICENRLCALAVYWFVYASGCVSGDCFRKAKLNADEAK